MKIFGVGLQRSGTTSLSMALADLGYKTCHFVTDESFYESADAFTDTPIYADYPELDIKYPGSKFILTVRDPDAWVESFNKAMSSMKGFDNLTTESKNYLPYMKIFGTVKVLNAKDLVKRKFIEHNNRVMEYFADRDDFLIIDTDNQSDEEKIKSLCKFLNFTYTGQIYPKASDPRHWGKFKHLNKVEK